MVLFLLTGCEREHVPLIESSEGSTQTILTEEFELISIETQLGYYVYKPFDYEIDIYQRIGAKYYLYKNIFTGIGLKTHGGRAEAIEATLGVRL